MSFSYSVEKILSFVNNRSASQEISHFGNPEDNYRVTRGPLFRAAFQPGQNRAVPQYFIFLSAGKSHWHLCGNRNVKHK